ncbi:MAG: hypothetical protein ACYC7B_14340 [Burkholderiales bacterium]
MNIFIIGAGFTKAVFPNAPLNRELLPALRRKFQDSALEQLCNRYGTQDIEIALTRLDVDLSAMQGRNDHEASSLENLRQSVERCLVRFFESCPISDALFTFSPWLTKLIDGAFARGDVVISLNYDCLIEGILDLRSKWSPNGGYGSLDNPLSYSGRKVSKSPVTVLKIHGSANFVSAPYADKPQCESINFEFDERFFPRSAKNTHFSFGGGTGKSYIIAPSYVKVPSLDIVYLMLDALKASRRAKNLVVIGSALRTEDGFLTVLATNFLRHYAWREKKIIVVDPSAKEITGRIQNFWGVNVSDQLLPIEGQLQRSVNRLLRALN